MNTKCFCGLGYYCPAHPHVPPFDSKAAAASLYSGSGSANGALSSHNLIPPTLVAQHSPTATTRGSTMGYPSSSSSEQPHPGLKRPLPPTSASTNPKRQRAQKSVGSTAGTSTAQSSKALSLRQIEAAQLAAASVPRSYCTDDSAEGVKRVQAARAIDCWYFYVGAYNKDEQSHLAPRCPARAEGVSSSEEKAKLRLADQARADGRAPLDLRKPSAPRLRCTECLKRDRWYTVKTNHNGGSAYHLRPHLLKEHCAAYFAACERIGYSTDDKHVPQHDDEKVTEPITAEGILRYMTEWFAEDDIPFNMVSHRGFRRFFSYIGQGRVTAKDIPDRHAIALKAQKLSAEAKDKIRREIKHARGRISCTSDLWTDESQRAFMSITVHFVNKHRRMVNRLIGFRVIEGDHAGVHLAEVFFEVVNEFGFEGKLGMITLDNASNNNTFMAQLETYMTERNLNFDRDGNRIRCFPHVVNLAVQAILAALGDSAKEFRNRCAKTGRTIDGQLESYLLSLESEPHNRIRRTAVALRHGQRRQNMRRTIREGNEQHIWRRHKLVDNVWILEEFQMKLLELILDCPTRWSSTRNMIERFLELYPAISRYIASDLTLAEYAVSHIDHEVLSDILDVLNLAHQTQELLSSDRTPTLALALPLYHALISKWRELQAHRPALAHAIGAGITKLEEYLEKTRATPAHIVAMALNPSIRYEWIDENWSAKEAENAREVVKHHMLRCLEEQQNNQINSATHVLPSLTSETATKRLNDGYDPLLTSGIPIRPTSALYTQPTVHPLVMPSSTNHAYPLNDAQANASPATLLPAPVPSSSSTTSTLNSATVELEHQRFMDIPAIPARKLQGLSALDYWMSKSSEVPLIYQVALDVLPAQASSVSSERVFSSSKLTCTQFRNKISTHNVEALQILKHSLRLDPEISFDHGPDLLDFMSHHDDELSGDTVIQTVD